MRCEGCRRRRTLTLVLMAIWTEPFESESGPLVKSTNEPEPDWPGAICCGRHAPMAAGDSGTSPKEFLLNWIAKPESGPIVLFSMVICITTRPFSLSLIHI